MKDVSELLAKRLKSLEAPFSREWLADFDTFTEFIQTNPITIKILEVIKKEKEEAHEPLIRHLKALFEDGRRCLREIETTIDLKDEVGSRIRVLSKLKVNPKNIEDPFFDLGSLYYKYSSGFVSLLRTLARDGSKGFISKYCSISPEQQQDTARLNVDVELTFSLYLQKCTQDIEKLSGQRTTLIWGRWDTLLKWAEWTKNGIPPSNDEFGHNLSNMFQEFKISETVQSCGLFFLERLANTQAVAIDSELCLKALELFLDQDDQYWIIVHFCGEKGEKSEFFIKRLQREAKSYALLKLLLEAEQYSPIEFPRLTHTLGELEIKNGLKKVFFPHKKFAGSFVQLSELDIAIDATAVLKSLSSLQKNRKHRPLFNYGYYYHCTLARV
jgi:hypothetical protein